MNIKNRIAKLESKTDTNTPPKQRLTDQDFDRSLGLLADVIGVTRDELDKGLREMLQDEHKK